MADNSSDKAAEFATVQSINLARLEAGEIKEVIALLEDLSGDLVGVLEKNKGSLEKQQKIATVKAAADKTIAAHYATISKKHQGTLEGVAANQSKAAAEQVNQAIGGGAFGGVKVFDPVLDAQQWNQLAKKTIVFGHPSRHWWEGQKVDLQDKFIGQIRQGYALGEDVDTMIRRVRGTKANSYKDGIMTAKKHEATALVRSSVQTISNTARMESFSKMKPAVKGLEWVATLDGDTTPICRGLDGKQWDHEKQPIGHDKTFPGAIAHWNCRSTQVPVLASWAELSGKKIPAIDSATLQARVNEKLKAKGWPADKIAKATVRARASQDGQVSAGKDFDKWLMGKPKSFQKKLLGPTRAELWWKNDLTMADLTDQSGRPLTIKQLEDSIASGDLPAETEGTVFEPLAPGSVEPFTDPDKAVQVQAAAAANLEEIINNPKGQTVLAGYVKKVMTEQPDLSPAEQLAKAEALTVEKKGQSQKTSALAKAKKKLIAGQEPTAGQQALIDGLTYEEKQAFLEAIDDAKKASSGQLLTDALAAIDEKGVVKGSDKFKQDIFDKLDHDQTAELVKAMAAKKKASSGQLLEDALAAVDEKGILQGSMEFKQAIFKELTFEQKDKIIDQQATNQKLHKQGQADSLKDDLKKILKDEKDPIGTLLQNSESEFIFNQLPEALQNEVKETSALLKFENQAKETIGELEKDPFGKKAVQQAKDQLGEGVDLSDIVDQAEELKAGLLIEDMAEQALTAKNKSAMAKALEDMIPGLKVKDHKGQAGLMSAIHHHADLNDLDDVETLHGAQLQIAKQIQDAKNKSSALAKAKKKLAAGQKPTKGQQALIDGLDPAEKGEFDAQVEASAMQAAIEKVKPMGAPADWFEQTLADIEAMPTASAAEASKKIAEAEKETKKAEQETAAAEKEVAAAEEEVKEVKELAGLEKREPLPPPEGIPHPSELKVIQTLGGSTGAKLAEDKDGNKFVVKRGNSAEHVTAEHEADELYRALGFEVPEGGLFDDGGQPVKVTRFLEGAVPLGELPAAKRKAAHEKLKQGMPVDAILGNWDVVGMGADNVMVTPDGTVYRIDNGGSMEFRAQGTLKTGADWNDYPDELWSLRDQAKNSSTAAAFGDMDIFEVAERVKAIDWDAIDSAPISEAQKQILKRRASEAVRVADRALDFKRDKWKADYTDKLTFEALEIRQAGVMAQAPQKLNVSSHMSITDDSGVAWGNYRTKASSGFGVPAKPKLPEDAYSGNIENAIKSIAHKAIGNEDISTGSALDKSKTALLQKPEVEKLAKKTGEVGEMAKSYLKDLNWIEAQVAKGGVPEKPKNFFKPYLPKDKPAPQQLDNRSLVSRWEARMAEKGIPVQPIASWLSSQSSNSWTPQTQAAKYAYGVGLEGHEKSQYWGGNKKYRTSLANCKAEFQKVAGQVGGEENAFELFRSYHALVQETLTTLDDAPWIDTKRRAALLIRTATMSEIQGSGKQGTEKGIYTPLRGTTESHSIYTKTTVMGSETTVTAVPFTRIHGLYWLEQSSGHGGSSFLGDGEGEFAANTSGLPTLHDRNYVYPKMSQASKNAKNWGVPIDHL